MKLQKIYSTTPEKIENRQHNIFIPICLGNKYFSHKGKITDNVERYIEWGLMHTRKSLLVAIADTIQISNYMVRNSNHSEGQNMRRIKKESARIQDDLQTLVEGAFPKEPIIISTWDQLLGQDIEMHRITASIYKEFKNNVNFRKAILKASKETVFDRKFSLKERWQLMDYILDEFALAYRGAKFSGIHYDFFPYPKEDATLYFIESIKNRELFVDFASKLPENKVGVGILQ